MAGLESAFAALGAIALVARVPAVRVWPSKEPAPLVHEHEHQHSGLRDDHPTPTCRCIDVPTPGVRRRPGGASQAVGPRR
jgi:hypothetical protein